MTGEEKRTWLQSIRKRIAEHNDIVYMQSDNHEKDCTGNCKVCQAEARYIDSELQRKAKLGDEVKLSSILSDLLKDVELTRSIDNNFDNSFKNEKSKTSKNNNERKTDKAKSIDDLDLTVHLDSAIRRYGIDNTDELYSLLKGDTVNMKKKLRGGYKYLVERLKEIGYEITEEMI